MDNVTPLTKTERALAGVLNSWLPAVTEACRDAAEKVVNGSTVVQVAEDAVTAYNRSFSDAAEVKYIGAQSLLAYRFGNFATMDATRIPQRPSDFEIFFDRDGLDEVGIDLDELVVPEDDTTAASSMLRAIANMGGER